MSERLGPGGTRKPPPNGDHEAAPKPRRYWWRFVLGSVLIVAVSAAATATGVLVFLDSIADKLGENEAAAEELAPELVEVDGGEPQTILLLGSDKRAGAEFAEDKGRSDTTMLVRIDADQGAISVMSIPRDLKVEIPGYGTAKFAEAFAYGGPKLTLRTVKDLTGLRIHHVVNVDFLGFAQAVYALGCVYADVDRRYYHSNEGVPPSEQYAEINVQPGYQLMCGKKALDYVRYRHTDTDIVRSARQQDFLSAARQRISPEDLLKEVFGGGPGLIDVFTDYTSSDIDDKETMIELLKLLVEARDAPIKEISFPAELGPSYVTASPEAIEDTVKQFRGGEASGGARGTLEETGAEKREKSKKGGKASRRQAAKKRKQASRPNPSIAKPKPPGSDGLVPAREAGEQEAEIAARRAEGPFPIYYPTRLPPATFYAESNPLTKVVDPYLYRIKDGDERKYLAYRMVLVGEKDDGIHYYGVQGIRGWEDPPILDNPSLTKKINGREYEIYVDGDRIRLIAWHRGKNSYWISNDLLRSLSNDQMVGMARSADVLVPKKMPRRKRSAE